MKVSIIIPVFNQLTHTLNCLRDLLITTTPIEIIIVNDASTDQTAKVIPKLFPQVKLLSNAINSGFAKTCNKGIAAATSNIICLLNNDTRLPNHNWLNLMLKTLDVCELTAPAFGRLDKSFEYVPGEIKTQAELDKHVGFVYPSGWCLMFKREVINKIGLIPEDMNKGFWEDVLFYYRAQKAGFKARITGGTQIQHLYHATFKAEGYDLAKEYQEKRKIFLELIK
jgi:GT2 family glycosyltransferase